MSTFTTWVVSGWIHLVIGVVVGWLVFKRPDIITNWINKIRAKIGI